MSNKFEENITIGARIWQEADRQNITKAEFSKQMDISRQTLDNWIDGKSAPDYYQVELASKILGVPFWPEWPGKSFKDEIFEGDYIGMHKRVWTQLEGSMTSDRGVLKSLADTLQNLTRSSGNQQ